MLDVTRTSTRASGSGSSRRWVDLGLGLSSWTTEWDWGRTVAELLEAEILSAYHEVDGVVLIEVPTWMPAGYQSHRIDGNITNGGDHKTGKGFEPVDLWNCGIVGFVDFCFHSAVVLCRSLFVGCWVYTR